MLVSMTGFGQGEASNRTGRVAVEIRTVNHRYFDLSVKMPRTLSSREHEIKDLIKNKIRRGRVSITVTTESEQPEYDVRINDLNTLTSGFPVSLFKGPGDVHYTTAGYKKLAEQVALEMRVALKEIPSKNKGE